MITKISCGTTAQSVYHFDNGNVVSIIWGWGSYSDNQVMSRDGTVTPIPSIGKQDYESTCVEIYSMGKANSNFTKHLEEKYGQNPAGYVPVNDIPELLRLADTNDNA